MISKTSTRLAVLAITALLSFGIWLGVQAEQHQAEATPDDAVSSANTPEAVQASPSISEQQRILCEIAFNNGSGTKFDTPAAFDEACADLFVDTDADTTASE